MMQDPSTYFNNQFPEHEILKCPRCDSSNTKFCYYNNYNLSQPRHYCKNCKRYWTKGGTLRNIPVGGASRKITKRCSSSSSNPKKPPPTITTTANNAHMSSSPADNTVNNNKKNQQQQQQQQAFVGTTTSSAASYLNASLYPRMSTGMVGFDGQMGQQSVDLKVEEMSEERFGAESGDMNCWGGNSNNDWPDLAIYTPGGSAFQ